jgi:hypothetical protein
VSIRAKTTLGGIQSKLKAFNFYFKCWGFNSLGNNKWKKGREYQSKLELLEHLKEIVDLVQE